MTLDQPFFVVFHLELLEDHLHLTAHHGHANAITALVKYGTDIGATLPYGEKPSDIAAKQGHGERFAEAFSAAKHAD